MQEFVHTYTHGPFTLEYRIYPGGKKALLAFHGFGKSYEDMEEFHFAFKETHTIYAFNFFHHGKSVYPSDRIRKNTLQPQEWNELMEGFLKQRGINRFSLFGFSMGGKLCFEMALHFTQRIEAMYLLAPDGLKNNFWYSMASNNRLGNYLYRGIIRNPAPFYGLMKTLRFTGMLNKKTERFARSNLTTREKRQLVHDVWMTLRHINPSMKNVGRIICTYQIPVFLVFGKYDRIIPSSLAKKLQEHCPSNLYVEVIDCGHNLIAPEAAQVIEKILQKNITGQ
jgi:pimeloyl-ACP methyl ester carboxylesterase